MRRLLATAGEGSWNDPVLRFNIIPALAQNGMFVQAREVSQTMDKSYPLYDEAVIEIAKGAAVAGEFDEAFATARSLDEQFLRTRAFVEIAAVYLGRGRVADARSALSNAFRGMIGPGGIDFSTRDSDSTDSNRYGAEALLKLGRLLAKIEAL